MVTIKYAGPQNCARRADNQRGLTLVEAMIAMTIFVLVVAGIYTTFTLQQESYLQTESHVTMVQEARAAQFFLARDVKMAGYDPTTYARTGFVLSNEAEVEISMDIAANGDKNNVESTRFALTDDDGMLEDGICPDGVTCRLSREWCSEDGTCGGLQPIAENVEALEFCYIIANTQVTKTPTAIERPRITSVFVSLLMRQTYRTQRYEDTDVYMPASGNEELTPLFTGNRSEGWGPFNDQHHRKLVIFEVKSRNIGMNPYLDL